MAAPKKYPDELRARAVRLDRESDPKPVIRKLAEQLGVHHEALRNWIRQAEADALMENVWSTLKIELVYRTSWRTRDEAENALFTYVDGWYNTRRVPSR